MSESRTKNSLRNVIINFIAKIIALLCGFVIRTIFLKYLGAQYTGVSSLFTDILNIFSLTELGLGTAVTFSFYKPVAEKDEIRLAQLMKLSKYIYGGICVFVLLLGFLFMPFVRFFVTDIPEIKEDIHYIYILYVVKSAASYLLIYKSTFLEAKQKQYIVTATETVCLVLKVTLDVMLLIMTRNFMVYLYLEIIFTVISNLIISIRSNRELTKFTHDIHVQDSDVKNLFANVKDVMLYKVSGIALNSTDSLIISKCIAVSAVAYYSNYSLILNSASNITYQVIRALTASIGNFAVSKSSKDQKRIFGMLNFTLFGFTSMLCTGIWLCIDPFVEILWGKQYVLEHSIVALLVLNLFIANMYMTVDMFRTANGIFHEGRFRPLWTAIINLVVSIVAVHKMGLFGVILGTVVSRVTTQLWYDPLLIYRMVFKDNVKAYLLRYLGYFLITLACCTLGTIFMTVFSGPPIVHLLAGAVFAILINVLLIGIVYFRTDEFKQIVFYIKKAFK